MKKNRKIENKIKQYTRGPKINPWRFPNILGIF